MSSWVPVVVFAVVALVACGVAVWLLQRSLDKPGGRDGLGTLGNGMGVMDQFFNPSQADAKEEQDRQKAAQHVMPKAEDDDRKHGRVDFHPDGSPRSIRINRPRS
ncbi:MAG: hypothetical protein PGN07_05435 [Aeromicrobium erythreum]